MRFLNVRTNSLLWISHVFYPTRYRTGICTSIIAPNNCVQSLLLYGVNSVHFTFFFCLLLFGMWMNKVHAVQIMQTERSSVHTTKNLTTLLRNVDCTAIIISHFWFKSHKHKPQACIIIAMPPTHHFKLFDSHNIQYRELIAMNIYLVN